MNNVSIEQFNNRFFPYLRLLTGSEFLYLSYIANLGKSRLSKKIENLIETFLIRLIPAVPTSFTKELTYQLLYMNASTSNIKLSTI